MPRLMLLRHAKSDWPESEVADIDRSLEARGKAAASEVGRTMAERGFLPDRILCSPARRARETLDRVLASLPDVTDVRVAPGLYDDMGADYLELIRSGGDGAEALLVVGHNTAMETTARALAHEESGKLRKGFPTAALAVFDVDGWDDLAPGAGRLVTFIRPAGRD